MSVLNLLYIIAACGDRLTDPEVESNLYDAPETNRNVDVEVLVETWLTRTEGRQRRKVVYNFTNIFVFDYFALTPDTDTNMYANM